MSYDLGQPWTDVTPRFFTPHALESSIGIGLVLKVISKIDNDILIYTHAAVDKISVITGDLARPSYSDYEIVFCRKRNGGYSIAYKLTIIPCINTYQFSSR